MGNTAAVWSERAASSTLLPFSPVSAFLLGFKKMKKDPKALSRVFWKRGRARKKNTVTGLGFFT